jgi:hypothetical protein
VRSSKGFVAVNKAYGYEAYICIFMPIYGAIYHGKIISSLETFSIAYFIAVIFE